MLSGDTFASDFMVVADFIRICNAASGPANIQVIVLEDDKRREKCRTYERGT
jgi:hypothetical protein